MTDNSSPRVVVPFTLVFGNTDNPGLKDFSPAVLPADAPEEEEVVSDNGGEAGDGADPKVTPSSAPASVPSSQKDSEADANQADPEAPVSAEKVSPTTEKAPTA